MEFNKTVDGMPEECRPVVVKYNDDDGLCVGLMPVVEGVWVTDASEAELYGGVAHDEIHQDRIPHEWAYIGDL